MLELNNITTHYGQAKILEGVDLKITKGECVALLGRNGAGKSTLMKTIMSIVHPSVGQVYYRGEDISILPDYKIARKGLGYVPEERRIFPDLTVFENLQVGIKRQKDAPRVWRIAQIYALFPKLEELKGRLGGHLSGGEQQMLTVARTLMGNPEVILLDEPTEGLAPIIVQQMVAAIKEFKKEGVSVLIAEQNQHTLKGLCERVCILERGQIVFDGTFESFMAEEHLREEYLGVRRKVS